MVVIGSYLLTSKHIRYKIDSKSDVYDKYVSGRVHSVNLTPSRLKDRCDQVFKMVPGRMKKLVIVNSTLSTFSMIQACAEVAEKYADEIMVIPPLLALITNALESIAKAEPPNPRFDDAILVVIITSKFADYVGLRRLHNFELYVAQYDRFGFDQCEEKFQSFYKDFRPDTTTFLVDDPLRYVADKIIREKLMHKNWFIKTFKRWDFALSYGAMLRAGDAGFDPRYRIANFSSGYYAKVDNEEVEILPAQSPLPCKIYGINCAPRQIQLFYFKDYEQLGNQLVYKEHAASYHKLQLTGSSTQLLGYVDYRGVPYAPLPRNYNRSTTIPYHLSGFRNQPPENASVAESATAASSADEGISSQSSSIVAVPHQVNFLFFDNWYAIEVNQNGAVRPAGTPGNEWKPLYLSAARGKPVIGEEAKKDYEKFPKHVIYDVLKVIGKLKKEIEVDVKWGFELKEINENVCFQIETSYGLRLIPFEIVLGVFLKAMKLDTESALDGIQLKEVHVSTRFGLTEAQKFLFHKAAEKNGLKILSFDEIAF